MKVVMSRGLQRLRDRRRAGRDSNRVPPKYKSDDALPLSWLVILIRNTLGVYCNVFFHPEVNTLVTREFETVKCSGPLAIRYNQGSLRRRVH
jgi:hypothetical protein